MSSEVNNIEALVVGEYISEELSSFLRQHITQAKCHVICEKKDLSGYTLYHVVRRNRKVSDKSIDALKELIEYAYKNYQQVVQSGQNLQKASK